MELSTTTIFLVNVIVALLAYLVGRESVARSLSKTCVSKEECKAARESMGKDCVAKHAQEAASNADLVKTLNEIKEAMKEAVCSIKRSEDRQWEALRTIASYLDVSPEVRDKILNSKGSQG